MGADELLATLPEVSHGLAVRTLRALNDRDRDVVINVLMHRFEFAEARVECLETMHTVQKEMGVAVCMDLVRCFEESPEEEAALLASLRRYWRLRPWAEVLRMSRADRCRLMAHFGQMVEDEKVELGRRLKDGGLVTSAVVLKLLDEEQSGRFQCTLCRARSDAAHYFKLCTQEDITSHGIVSRAEGFAGGLLGHGDLEGSKNAWSKSRSAVCGLEATSKVCVLWGPELNAARRIPVDPTTLCEDCREKVHAYVSELTRGQEVHHLRGAKLQKALETRRALDLERAKWFADEGQRTELRDLLDLIRRIKRNQRTRAYHAAKDAAESQRKDCQNARRAAELAHLALLKTETKERTKKWVPHDEVETSLLLRKRTLLGALQNMREQDAPVEELAKRWSPREVENGGVSSKKREFSEGGVPLTAPAAAFVFGSAAYTVQDERGSIALSKAAALEFETQAEAQRAVFALADAKLASHNWETDLGRWRDDAMLFDDARFAKEQKLIADREERQRLRKLRKEEMAVLCEVLREEGHCREENERLALREMLERKRKERLKEAESRTGMSMEEVTQRSIDRFWGQPTEAERQRRLGQVARLVWASRIAACRSVMRKAGAIAPLYDDRDELLRRKPPLKSDKDDDDDYFRRHHNDAVI